MCTVQIASNSFFNIMGPVSLIALLKSLMQNSV